jgi:hypothetical protein
MINNSDLNKRIEALRKNVSINHEEIFIKAFDTAESIIQKYAIAVITSIPNLTLKAKKSLVVQPEFENLLIYNTYFKPFYLETLVKYFDHVKDNLNLFFQTTRGEFITTCPEDLLKCLTPIIYRCTKRETKAQLKEFNNLLKVYNKFFIEIQTWNVNDPVTEKLITDFIVGDQEDKQDLLTALEEDPEGLPNAIAEDIAKEQKVSWAVLIKEKITDKQRNPHLLPGS